MTLEQFVTPSQLSGQSAHPQAHRGSLRPGGKDGRPMRKMRVRGFRSAGFMTALTIGCHSLLRVAKLLPEPALVPT